MNSPAFFWVEILDKSGAVFSRQRIQANVATIGRRYDNDVVIDDVFVAPSHLRIVLEPPGTDNGATSSSTLWVEDLGSVNGTVDISRASNITRMPVANEALIRIGQSEVRVRRGDFEVAAALPLPVAAAPLNATPVASMTITPTNPLATFGYGKAAAGLMALFVATLILSTWLSHTTEYKLAAYLPGGVIFPLLVIGWAGIWTLLTRLVTTHGQFFRHVAIAFAFMLVIHVADVAADFASYALAWVALQKWLPSLAWAMFGALCFAHIRVISPKHNRLTGGILGALVVIAIGAHLSLRAEAERTQPMRISAKLMPPFLLMKTPESPDAFFKGASALVPKLEEERKKEPTSGGFSLSDFD